MLPITPNTSQDNKEKDMPNEKPIASRLRSRYPQSPEKNEKSQDKVSTKVVNKPATDGPRKRGRPRKIIPTAEAEEIPVSTEKRKHQLSSQEQTEDEQSIHGDTATTDAEQQEPPILDYSKFLECQEQIVYQDHQTIIIRKKKRLKKLEVKQTQQKMRLMKRRSMSL